MPVARFAAQKRADKRTDVVMILYCQATPDKCSTADIHDSRERLVVEVVDAFLARPTASGEMRVRCAAGRITLTAIRRSSGIR